MSSTLLDAPTHSPKLLVFVATAAAEGVGGDAGDIWAALDPAWAEFRRALEAEQPDSPSCVLTSSVAEHPTLAWRVIAYAHIVADPADRGSSSDAAAIEAWRARHAAIAAHAANCWQRRRGRVARVPLWMQQRNLWSTRHWAGRTDRHRGLARWGLAAATRAGLLNSFSSTYGDPDHGADTITAGEAAAAATIGALSTLGPDAITVGARLLHDDGDWTLDELHATVSEIA